jgi:Ca-activated chloride channel homolog
METSSLTFSQPAWFFALAIVPIVAALYFWSQRRSDALLSRVVAPRLRVQLASAVSMGRRTLKSALILIVFGLVAVALARPQMGFIQREVKQRGRDVILAIDTSRSMLATDIAPNRLARAKLVAQDLLHLVRGDRIGLVAFAGSAFLQAPLTLDYNAVLTSLEELDTTVIPKGGTNIAEAIRTAEQAFGKGEGQTRALIILTDGEELDANGIAAAKRAAALGVRIFTVGIGSGEGSLIPLRTEGGGTDFVRDTSGKPVQSKLDEKRLKEIAEAGGGFYEPLSADAARVIFENGILKLDQTETGIMTSRQPIERYQWPLSVAVGLLALWLVLGDRRRSSALPKGAVAAALLLALSPSVSTAATGLQEYEAGHFDKAQAEFERRLQTTPESDKLHFNAGAASYKLGEFAKAVDHFTKALLSEDQKLREDSSYNLANSLVRRGEAAKENERKKADWKNAIQHYSETLKLDPKNKQAEENREIVKKMLEDLQKREQDQQKKQDQQQQQKQDQQQQQKQDQQQQQKQDQQQQQKQDQQQQQKQDQQQQQKQDQQQQQKQDQQQQQKQDQQQQQKQDQQQQRNEDQKDQPKSDEKNGGKPEKSDQSKDQEQQEMAQNRTQQGTDHRPQPTPQPTPGEKKRGDLEHSDEEQKPDSGGGATESEPVEKEGEMSAGQARGLLNSLRSEEERVRLMQRHEMEDTLKDW